MSSTRHAHEARSTTHIRRQSFKTLPICCELLPDRVRFVLWDPVLSKRAAALYLFDASTTRRKTAALFNLSPLVMRAFGQRHTVGPVHTQLPSHAPKKSALHQTHEPSVVCRLVLRVVAVDVHPGLVPEEAVALPSMCEAHSFPRYMMLYRASILVPCQARCQVPSSGPIANLGSSKSFHGSRQRPRSISWGSPNFMSNGLPVRPQTHV